MNEDKIGKGDNQQTNNKQHRLQSNKTLMNHLILSLFNSFIICFRLVLYKERNMLMTELQISRRRQIIFPQPDRMRKVRKSMGAIRHVLGERKIAAIASFRERQMLQELEAQNTQAETGENDDEDDMMEGEGHSAMDDESEAIEDSKSTSDGAPDKK